MPDVATPITTQDKYPWIQDFPLAAKLPPDE
jgi:hypothetical protein